MPGTSALERITVAGFVLAVSIPAAPGAQAPPDVSGVWVLDASRKDAREVYGELRVVEQDEHEVRVTMVDYGTAWIGGGFRPVLRIVPWTYRFDRWAPRRGGPDSTQPVTRARWSGERLVLAKTPGESFGHVWVWGLDAAAGELRQQETNQTWDSDFTQKDAEGGRTYFLRGGELERAGVEASREIVIGVDEAARELVVSCPRYDCVLVELLSGRRVGSRPLARGAPERVPLMSEAVVEPAASSYPARPRAVPARRAFPAQGSWSSQRSSWGE